MEFGPAAIVACIAASALTGCEWVLDVRTDPRAADGGLAPAIAASCRELKAMAPSTPTGT